MILRSRSTTSGPMVAFEDANEPAAESNATKTPRQHNVVERIEVMPNVCTISTEAENLCQAQKDEEMADLLEEDDADDPVVTRLADKIASLQRALVDGQRRLLVELSPQIEVARKLEHEVSELRRANRRLQADLHKFGTSTHINGTHCLAKSTGTSKVSLSSPDTPNGHSNGNDGGWTSPTRSLKWSPTNSTRWAQRTNPECLTNASQEEQEEVPELRRLPSTKDLWQRVRVGRRFLTLPKKLHEGVRNRRAPEEGSPPGVSTATTVSFSPEVDEIGNSDEAPATPRGDHPPSPKAETEVSMSMVTPGDNSPRHKMHGIVPEASGQLAERHSVTTEGPTHHNSQASISSYRPLVPDPTLTSALESSTGLNPHQVVWQWLHRTGFKNYDPSAIEKIEKAYREGESKVRVKSGKGGGTPMEIFFEDMLQYDPTTGGQKKVRRVGPHGWGLHIRRYVAGCMRRLETGKPRREKFDDYQKRRNELREGLDKTDYDVRDYYKTKGCIASIARSNVFSVVTMAGVLLNAIWMCVDADLNNTSTLIQAEPHFQLMEHFFCAFFTIEIMIRFSAFEVKRSCLRDGWFNFDLALVVLMVAEIWVIPFILFVMGMKQGSALDNLGVLRLLRLLRLTRVARLLRAVPEVMVLLKGISAALKSVSFTLVLLLVLVYVFGIVFKSVTHANDTLRQDYFPSVGDSMLLLLCYGTLLDSVGIIVFRIKDEAGIPLAMVFLLYIFLSSFTVLNMLIGILCHVMQQVSQNEQDAAEVAYLKNHVLCILECYDKNGDHSLSREEFDLLMENPELHECLNKFGTDVNGLKSLADVLFAGKPGIFTGKSKASDKSEQYEDKSLTFQEFLSVVLRLRGEKSACVTDVVELREYVRQRHDHFEAMILAGAMPAQRSDTSLAASTFPASRVESARCDSMDTVPSGRRDSMDTTITSPSSPPPRLDTTFTTPNSPPPRPDGVDEKHRGRTSDVLT